MTIQKICVVIPSYNRKAYLIQSVNSVLDQELPVGWKSHCLVVDDGSTDGTFQSLCEYYRLDAQQEGSVATKENLTLLRIENSERGAARNFGSSWALKNNLVDWFLYLDSDDVLLAESLLHFSKRLKSGEDPNVVALYGAIDVWDGVTPLVQNSRERTSREGDLSALALDWPFLPLGATFIKSDLFVSLGGFCSDRQMSGSEDWLFLSRVLLAGKILFIPRVLTAYRQHRGNTVPVRFLTSIDLATKALLPYVKLCFHSSPSNAMTRVLQQSEILKAGILLRSDRWTEAARVLFSLALSGPRILFSHRWQRVVLSLFKRLLLKNTKPFKILDGLKIKFQNHATSTVEN